MRGLTEIGNTCFVFIRLPRFDRNLRRRSREAASVYLPTAFFPLIERDIFVARGTFRRSFRHFDISGRFDNFTFDFEVRGKTVTVAAVKWARKINIAHTSSELRAMSSLILIKQLKELEVMGWWFEKILFLANHWFSASSTAKILHLLERPLEEHANVTFT